MKFIITIIFALSISFLNAQNHKNPFKNIKYDSVVIYEFDWRGPKSEIFSIIDTAGKLASTVKKSVKLNSKSAKEITSKLGSKSSYGGAGAICFEPHLGIVHYKDNVPIIHTTVCLSCNIIVFNVANPAQMRNNIRTGMSEEFIAYLGDLVKQNKFKTYFLRR